MKGLRVLLGIVGVLALSVLGLTSCSEGKLLVVNTLARSGDYQLQADLAYGADPRQRLDLYLPAPGVSADMTLVFIPGGCWGACGTFPKEDYRFVADTLTAHGYGVAIVNYRLYPQHGFADIIADVALAVDFLEQQAVALGASNKWVLMGHSAGGQMAALLALDERYLDNATRLNVKALIGLAGPYDFLPFTEDYQPALFAPEARYGDSQPVNFVDGTEPPALLLYGNSDTRVKPRNIMSLSKRMGERGVRYQARCYDGIDHTGIIAALSRPLRDSQPVLADILAFLQQVQSGTLVADTSPPVCGSVAGQASVPGQ